MDKTTLRKETPPLMMGARDIIALGFSRTTAYQFLSRADMPVVMIGGRKFMHRDLFLDWLASQAASNKEVVE